MKAQEQINKLAKFILGNIEGEPSKSEGACAIRLLKEHPKYEVGVNYSSLKWNFR